VFPPYDAPQLCDILKQRADIAFNEGILDEGVIPLCAALAAQEHGDARRALDLLRVSGELADRENAEKVTERHVKMAQEKLGAGDFSKVAGVVPGINAMMSSAPKSGGMLGDLGKIASGFGGGASQLGTLASLAGGFSQLGMDTGMIGKFIPMGSILLVFIIQIFGV
jgi:hypothetical protein